VKVQDEANLSSEQSQIGQELRFVDGGDTVDAFQFDDDAILHEHVYLVADIKLNTFVLNRQRHLPLKSNATQMELMTESSFVRRLEQSGAQMSMHLDRCPDYLFGEVVSSRNLAGVHRCTRL